MVRPDLGSGGGSSVGMSGDSTVPSRQGPGGTRVDSGGQVTPSKVRDAERAAV